jgi:uncharacterized membrane protein YhaH (DUF805 family)
LTYDSPASETNQKSTEYLEEKMGFVDAIKSGFSNYVGFSGRARRSEYWYWVLFVVLASIVVSMISELLGQVFSLGVLLPGIAMGARRLHDIGKSGWWQLLGLIPLLGWLVLIYWAVQPSEGDNGFGPTPAP